MARSHGQVGVALVGCGTVARLAHVPTLRRLAGARLLAVVDPDEAARNAVARAGGAAPFESLEEALGTPGVDAVVVCSPSSLHAEHAAAACRAGKHVYVEKPLAADLEGGRRIAEAALEARVNVVVGYNRRLHPTVVHARAALAQGRIGELFAVRSIFCQPDPAGGLPEWKRTRATGGGVLLDLASHHVDLIRWLLGREVTSASAILENRRSELDTASVLWTLEGGVAVQGLYSLGAGPLNLIELIGERGVVAIDRMRGVATIAIRRSRTYGMRRARSLSGIAGVAGQLRRAVQPSHDESYGRALSAFVDLVAGRTTADTAALATADDGLRALEAVVLAEASCGH